MSESVCSASLESTPGPEVVADLLGVLARHNMDTALTDIEQLVARLRADVEEVAAAREVLANIPAQVLRAALRLRADRMGTAR